MWHQVHVLGKFKADDKPSRAAIESIIKAGGANLVDATEAASANLVIVHHSLAHDDPKVCLKGVISPFPLLLPPQDRSVESQPLCHAKITARMAAWAEKAGSYQVPQSTPLSHNEEITQVF